MKSRLNDIFAYNFASHEKGFRFITSLSFQEFKEAETSLGADPGVRQLHELAEEGAVLRVQAAVARLPHHHQVDGQEAAHRPLPRLRRRAEVPRPQELLHRAVVPGEGLSVLPREHHDGRGGAREGDGADEEGAGEPPQGAQRAGRMPIQCCRDISVQCSVNHCT